MWEQEPERLALLELLLRGRLLRRKSQERAWKWLSELAWTRRTSRRNVIRLVSEHEQELIALLNRVWPDWKEAQARLSEQSLPPTEVGWRELLDRERVASTPGPMPVRLNRRTAIAVVGPHSKASLSDTRRQALAEVDLTRDGLVRMRPTPRLRLVHGDLEIDVDSLLPLMQELVLTERSLRDGTKVQGSTAMPLLLVENLGTYLDLTPPAGWLVAHVPGWDTATVRVLLERMRDVPLVHFGDLDPNGVRIVRHLLKIRPDLIWAVPAFWSELAPKRALRKKWPPGLVLPDDPPLVRELSIRGLWLEQETIALDPRLPEALLFQLRSPA